MQLRCKFLTVGLAELIAVRSSGCHSLSAFCLPSTGCNFGWERRAHRIGETAGVERVASLRGHLQRQALSEASWLGELASELPDRVVALGPLGPIYFQFAFVITSCLMLPVTPLMISAGYLFGAPLGIGVTFLAICASASIAFLLSRSLLQKQAESLVAKDKRLQKINVAVECEGVKIISLLRLSPLLPFAASSYALGASNVSFFDYLLGTALGYAPWIVAYANLSSTAGGLLDDGKDYSVYAYAAAVLSTGVLLKLVIDTVESAVDQAIQQSAESCSVGD